MKLIGVKEVQQVRQGLSTYKVLVAYSHWLIDVGVKKPSPLAYAKGAILQGNSLFKALNF